MSVEHSQTPNKTGNSFAYLQSYKFVKLTTFRKDGTPVPTPVWFALDGQRKLYVMTPSTTGKLKRIRNNGRVLLAPCTRNGKVLGDQVEGMAHILLESESKSAIGALARQYGPVYSIFATFMNMRRVRRTFIEIEPV